MSKKQFHAIKWVDWADWALFRIYVVVVLGTYCVGLQVGPVCCEVTCWEDAYIEITD